MKTTDNIGIIINTEYHHATALSIYQSLRHLNLSPRFYYNCSVDKFKFNELCVHNNLAITKESDFDINIIITAQESHGYIPGFNFNYNPAFNNKSDFIFIHHRPLKYGIDNIKKHFPNSINIANGTYESPFSNDYFFQTESPVTQHAMKNNTIGVVSRFFENKISMEYVNTFLQKNNCNMHLLGEGSAITQAQIKYANIQSTDLCSHYEFYEALSKFNALLIPYSAQMDEYTGLKITEALTHSIAHKIPIIANKKFLEYYNLKQIDSSFSHILDILADEIKYNLLKDELKVFQNNSREHNNKLFERILKA